MMKARKRERRRSAKPGGESYVFRLFVAGNESNSSQARGNLARLCEEHIKGRYKIDTVDVLKDAAAAHKNNVLVTPTLILIRPLPKVTVLGNLNDTRQVLAALRLNGDEG
ncbi:MAG TPA: circadian clock KaiB family protein [Candidatus Acidoferrum sp.]|nr:circadian clock KaiB family protein [Candidatus Acidoferrum sp.]